MTIDDQLQALKEAERRYPSPPALEARVLAAFDDSQRRGASHRRSYVGAMALAAGVVLGVGGTAIYFQRQAAPVVPAQQVGESVVFALDPPGAGETVRVVRIRVARAALESLGIRTLASGSGSASSESVEVDVLVGDDGVARGVRLAM